MENGSESTHAPQHPDEVRRNVVPGFVAAAMMLYFGFAALARPTGDDLFTVGATIFYHTLRIGGVVMVIVSALLLTGRLAALLLDAIACIPIGILLVLSGVLMLADGGGAIQSGLNVLFGGFFLTAGIQSTRVLIAVHSVRRGYVSPMRPAAELKSSVSMHDRRVRGADRPSVGDSGGTNLPGALRSLAAVRGTTPSSLLDGRVPDGSTEGVDDATVSGVRGGNPLLDNQSDEDSEADAESSRPEEGYLASFSRMPPPPTS